MSSRTQIVATIGPASGSLEMLEKLIAEGMDVVRLNFSHGSYNDFKKYISNIREAAQHAGKHVPIIQDLSGPRLQQGAEHHFDAEKDILTEKDLSDLSFGISEEVDYIAQSFVGSARDVARLRNEIEKRGGTQPIIVKIERQVAVNAFDEIVAAADAVMIARGDLGDAVPLGDVPFIERGLVARTRAAGKPVIVATQMLLSMTGHDAPTRAEVTDVAFAVLCQADAVMLSEETARGEYPVEAARAMETILNRSEREIQTDIRLL